VKRPIRFRPFSLARYVAVIAVAAFAALLIGIAPASAVKEIHVRPPTLTPTGHECNDTEWHFVITQTDTANAPASIHVTWANGQSADVPIDDPNFNGGTASYTTTLNLDSVVTDATAEINDGWDGNFNLSHGPCGPVPPPSTAPPETSPPGPPGEQAAPGAPSAAAPVTAAARFTG
jgi:hypothetical protein